MLGGGTFTVQNKILNGAYINFVSMSKASASLSDRGVATMPLELDWGVDNAIFEVTPADFQKNSMKIFGYPFTHEKMKGLRDLFMNIKTLYAYKLTSGGAKATNTYATAKYSGIRGNDLKISISANVDEPSKFDVRLYMDTTVVYEQFAVASAAELKDNDFVDWKAESSLASAAGVALSGGTNGTVSGTSHQAYLDKAESYSFNTMGVVVTDDTTKNLYVAFVKRMRDQVGAKFQCVLHNKPSDYEGVINVKNDAVGSGSVADLVYWVTGAEAGCPINKTLLNQKYDGEFTVDVDHKQSVLEAAMTGGEFMFHNVNGEVRVLADINSFVSGTDEKSVEMFGENQCVRVMDQIANDIAVLFNSKYLGKVPNDAAGRISLWNDIVKHHSQLQDIRAIQDFNPDDVTVNQGDKKNSVVVGDAVTIVVGMAKLYMTVTVQ
jgi:hypothetical protein